MQKLIFNDIASAQTKVNQMAPQALSTEPALFSTSVNWSTIGIQTAGAKTVEHEGKMYFDMVVLTVMVDGWKSKSGKEYPKGTQFVVPAK